MRRKPQRTPRRYAPSPYPYGTKNHRMKETVMNIPAILIIIFTMGVWVSPASAELQSLKTVVNPANLMGATKGMMEQVMWLHGDAVEVASARFANVAFSDGSLLAGFIERLHKKQPLSAPFDVRRYFITDGEAAQLCLLACFCGNSRDVFAPRMSEDAAERFDVLAERFVRLHGYEPQLCATEDEARALAGSVIAEGRWPCYFFETDTTGEKDLEEFWGDWEVVDDARYGAVLVMPQSPPENRAALYSTIDELRRFIASKDRDKQDIIDILGHALPKLSHIERGKSLHQRM